MEDRKKRIKLGVLTTKEGICKRNYATKLPSPKFHK